MKTVLIVLAALILLPFIAWQIYRAIHRHVGYGLSVSHYPTGITCITSHLLDSPAGRAKIPLRAKILMWNGVSFAKLTLTEFRDAMKTVGAQKCGDKAKLILSIGDEISEVELVAEMIQGPIPDYSDLVLVPVDDPYRTSGLAHCARTGQLIPTSRLRHSALDAVMRRRSHNR